MKRVHIVLNHLDPSIIGTDPVIGVDYGAFLCARASIPMIYACGDFDSVDGSEQVLIETSAQMMVSLPTEKDMTDFMFALSLCDEYEHIIVHGALGGRLDHQYLHVEATKRDARLMLRGERQIVYSIQPGTHIIEHQQFQYTSFFPLDSGELSLIGFKYPLDEEQVSVESTYLTSNEIIGKQGTVVTTIPLLVIQASDSNY